jgi:hypothetical protein
MEAARDQKHPSDAENGNLLKKDFNESCSATSKNP